MSSFQTKGVAVVTGAASGIGRGVAFALAQAGASVVIFADIKKEAAEEAAKLSHTIATYSNYKAFGWELDVSKADQVKEFFERVRKEPEVGRLDYLVNSAGVDNEKYKGIPEDDQDDFDRLMSINVRGMLLCTREAVKIMKDQDRGTYSPPNPILDPEKDLKEQERDLLGPKRDLGRGCIVNILSTMAYMTVPNKVGYTVAKHAGLGLTKSAAKDLMGKGIRVNALCPGFVDTPMHKGELEKLPGVEILIKTTVSLERAAYPIEAGESVVYLCSPAASYVNGIGLIMDAGLTVTTHMGV